MATSDSAYLMFYETLNRWVGNLNLNGKVTKINRFDLNAVQVSFEFFDKYLSIYDDIYFEQFYFDRKTIFENTVNHIKEISYQFRFYFEGIWG